MMKKWMRLWFLWGLLLLPSLVLADNTATDRRAFLVALSDLQRHKQSEFLVIVDHLRYYPLYPYLIYAELAIHLSVFLPANQKNSFMLWRETAENPLLILNPKLFSSTNTIPKEYILLTAIQKLTHKNPRLAAEIWAKVAKQTQFELKTQSKV